jgi:hypothetical protein
MPESYADELIALLNGSQIPYQYNPEEATILLIRQDDHGELFHLFNVGDVGITGFTLFSWRVPPESRTIIRTQLLRLNRHLKHGYFYLDDLTRCIIYCINYSAYTQIHGAPNLPAFLHTAITTATTHQPTLLQLAGASG